MALTESTSWQALRCATARRAALTRHASAASIVHARVRLLPANGTSAHRRSLVLGDRLRRVARPPRPVSRPAATRDHWSRAEDRERRASVLGWGLIAVVGAALVACVASSASSHGARADAAPILSITEH